MSLTAPERETVITFSDADDTAQVHTHQRKIITELKNNPAAELIEDISFGGTAGAVWVRDQLARPRQPGHHLDLSGGDRRRRDHRDRAR